MRPAAPLFSPLVARLSAGLPVLAASAVLAATGPALADDALSLTLTGVVEVIGGVTAEDRAAGQPDIRDHDLQSESFVTVTAQATADNGLTYGVRIDLDDIQSNGPFVEVDEVSLFLTGGFGTVSLGDDDGAADNFEVDPPTVGAGQIDGSWTDFLTTGTVIAYGSANSGDTTAIYYATPTIRGFQAGLSYTPENDSGDTLTLDGIAVQGGPAGTGWENALEAGLTWTGSLGPVDLTAGGTILAATGLGPADDPLAWQLGARGKVGGASLGLQVWGNDAIAPPGPPPAPADGRGLNLAATWQSGSWGVGAGLSWARADFPGGRQEDRAVAIGLSYDPAPGLGLGADLVHLTSDGATAADDADAVILVSSVTVAF
jgi:hypothetical protein